MILENILERSKYVLRKSFLPYVPAFGFGILGILNSNESYAQSKKNTNEIGLSGNISLGTTQLLGENFKQFSSEPGDISLKFSIGPESEYFGMRIFADYFGKTGNISLSASRRFFGRSFRSESLRLNDLYLGGEFVLNLASKKSQIVPYFLGGAGYHRLTFVEEFIDIEQGFFSGRGEYEKEKLGFSIPGYHIGGGFMIIPALQDDGEIYFLFSLIKTLGADENNVRKDSVNSFKVLGGIGYRWL